MIDHLPKRYWRFRNIVSATQLLVLLMLFAAVLTWAATDGNGVNAVTQYYEFSQTFSAWANATFKFPWGG
ncbi:hypothetical protein C5B85_11755 [Pseudoclavibacter sp. AY1F1]|nr:hypothetical protein C5B85_11755 [Pseudoclavibacter sp. AY1F1]